MMKSISNNINWYKKHLEFLELCFNVYEHYQIMYTYTVISYIDIHSNITLCIEIERDTI